MADEFVFEFESAVRGYHFYQDAWNPSVGDLLHCIQEPTNEHDRFAVACVREGTEAPVVGHLPREIARTCFYFLEHNGTIEACVTQSRRYCREVGGMEIPCRLRFTGKRKHIKKLKEILEKK